MPADGRLHRLAQVVGAVGQEDERPLGILAGVLSVHHVEHVDEAAGIASFHEVPVALALVVHLGGVHNLHAVEVHLALGIQVEGDGAAQALVVEGHDLAVGALGVHAGQGAQLIALGVGDDDVGGIAVAAERDGDGSLRAYEQVNLVVLVEGPAVLAVVVVESLAPGVESLVVLGIEDGAGEVEGVLLVGAHSLYLRAVAIEVEVAGDDVVHGVLAASVAALKPSAHAVALRDAIVRHDVAPEAADGRVLLHLLGGDDGLPVLRTDVVEGEVGLLHDVQHIVHGGALASQGDGDGAACRVALVGDGAQLAGEGRGRNGILGADHRHLLRQLEVGLVGIVEDFGSCIFLSVDGQRGQHGHVLLRAVEDALDDDVGEAYLLTSLQVVEVDEQPAGALAGRGALDVV